MKKLLLIFLFLLIPTFGVSANGVDFDTDPENIIDLGEIRIPLFNSNALDFVGNASIISWLAFAGGVFSVAILAFWIVRILLAGVQALQSEGDPTKLSDSYAKLRSNFVGMFITFLIPIVLSIVGFFFGIGTIFQWPESFQLCENSEYRFYFEAFIKEGSKDAAESACGIS